MAEYNSQFRDVQRENCSFREHSNDDDPPMSRLFIICNKSHTAEDFHEAFEQFGDIEDIWVVKDKRTQENKGIAYVKYTKTSDAAKAQEEMNGKSIGQIDRPLKVLVASNRNEGSNKSENEHEKYLRLFIVIQKRATEKEIRDDFSQWGNVESVTIVKDQNNGKPKGFGYVRFSKFFDAAVAFENCSNKYKAVFAEPKGSGRSYEINSFNRNRESGADNCNTSYNDWTSTSFNTDVAAFLRLRNVAVKQLTFLEVIASNCVNQEQLLRLFDIIPGLDYCQITREYGPGTNEVTVVYDNPEAAIYAKDKFHGLEYPLGERINAKVVGMSSARMDTSFIAKRTNKDSVCNVLLPPAQSLAPSDAPVAQRLFIVVASNLPQFILKNVFSCWNGLIDVYLLPNKNCGYVKYADRDSAQTAIQVLNGAEICGINIKVMEAEERGYVNEIGGKRVRNN